MKGETDAQHMAAKRRRVSKAIFTLRGVAISVMTTAMNCSAVDCWFNSKFNAQRSMQTFGFLDSVSMPEVTTYGDVVMGPERCP